MFRFSFCVVGIKMMKIIFILIMEVKNINEVNMNNEGLIYLNNNLKIHALKLSLINKFV